MPKQQTYQWDKYVQEAKIEPFVLNVKDGEQLTFEAPSGVALMRIMQGMREGDLELILVALTGDQWPRLEQLLGDAGHKAFPALVEDLCDHFEIYEDVSLVGPGGGKVTARRPREIQALINQGYRPVGEAASRT